ncbi:MAG TPA: uroporphyrinogen decarboxylase [Chitinophagaceae bacterium]|mgnify:FL=1|nr:uroporphyrinogen decarboxylase [Chitinophagaceae bacterium]HPH30814.1 uroporphyrinogen decarboxylase [Chitinophagaceae bacterium]
MNWIDWVGYLAAGLVVISFMMGSNLRTVRLINMFGAITFLIYGVLLDINLPIIIPNGVITMIQFYYLFIKKEKRDGE